MYQDGQILLSCTFRLTTIAVDDVVKLGAAAKLVEAVDEVRDGGL